MRIFITILLVLMVGAAAAAQVVKTINGNYELSGKIENGTRIIEVTASRYKFQPDPIVVKLGDKIRILATSADVPHGFAIQEFNVNSRIDPGKTNTIEFTVDKEGEFTEYCSVYCGPGHMGMHGKFIVVK